MPIVYLCCFGVYFLGTINYVVFLYQYKYRKPGSISSHFLVWVVSLGWTSRKRYTFFSNTKKTNYSHMWICLCLFTIEGSSSTNFKTFNVLPVKLLFIKCWIFFLIKNIHFWVKKNYVIQKREHLAYNIKVHFRKKSFGRNFVVYLATTYNSMPLVVKKNTICNQLNVKKPLN